MYGYSHSYRSAKNRLSLLDRTKDYWLSSVDMNLGNLQEDTVADHGILKKEKSNF